MDLRSLLAQVLHDQAGVTLDGAAGSTTFDELGVDSLTMVEITLILQDRLRIQIEDEELGGATTVAEAVAMLESKSAAAAVSVA